MQELPDIVERFYYTGGDGQLHARPPKEYSNVSLGVNLSIEPGTIGSQYFCPEAKARAKDAAQAKEIDTIRAEIVKLQIVAKVSIKSTKAKLGLEIIKLYSQIAEYPQGRESIRNSGTIAYLEREFVIPLWRTTDPSLLKQNVLQEFKSLLTKVGLTDWANTINPASRQYTASANALAAKS